MLGEGYKKDLEMEDLYEVRKEDESEILGDRLEKYKLLLILMIISPFVFT